MSKPTRRSIFSILPATAMGCAGCASSVCAAAPAWSEKADMTWEQVFRFAFQKDYIPVMKGLAERIGKEQFIAMLRQIVGERAQAGMANRKIPSRDFTTFVSGFKSMPPLYRAALTAEIVQDTPDIFEYKVSRCLWAKAFRDEDAGDIGYALVCYPDFAVARGFNPAIRLTREKTLMQGGDCCAFRYEMKQA